MTIGKDGVDMAKKYYAVKKGRTPGIYMTWDDCRKMVDGFPDAKYKSFKTLEEAKEFIDSGIDNKIDLINDNNFDSGGCNDNMSVRRGNAYIRNPIFLFNTNS